MPDTTEVVQDVLGPGKDLLAEITDDPVFITYKLEWNAKREKYEKVPHNGKHNLSYSNSADCKTFTTALELATGNEHISGIGIVFQGGIIEGDWQLIGLDFDGVENIDTFPLPVRSYAEVSPSGTGIHQYAWAPITWAGKLKNTGSIKLAGCHHAEFYCSTCYLTLTGNQINVEGIARLTDAELATLKGWKLNQAEKPLGERPDAPELEVGKAIGLLVLKYSLPDKQRLLLDGKLPVGGRSEPFRGLLLRLMTLGHPDENILATLLENQGLWDYLLSKRDDNPDRAAQLAREEVERARIKYNQDHPSARLIERSRAEVRAVKVDPVTSTSAPAYPPPYPGPMADAVAASLQVQYKPQPELTTLAVLVAMAASCGSCYARVNGSTVNLYGLGVLPTAAGKNAPQQHTKRFAGLGNVKLISAPASGEGLEDELASNLGTFCVVDEVGHLIALTNSDKALPHHITLMKKILELFGAGSDPNFTTRPKAGKEARKIPNPALNVIGFTTPLVLGKALTLADIENGLAGRFLFVVSDRDPKSRLIDIALETPKSFQRAAQGVSLGLQYRLGQGKPILIGLADGAQALREALNDEFDQCGSAFGKKSERRGVFHKKRPNAFGAFGCVRAAFGERTERPE